MTKPKAPEDLVRPKKKPAKAAPVRMGRLVCDDCSITVLAKEDSTDWPQHRCGFDVRPFARWQYEVPE